MQDVVEIYRDGLDKKVGSGGQRHAFQNAQSNRVLGFEVFHGERRERLFAQPAGGLQALGVGRLCHCRNAGHAMARQAHLLPHRQSAVRHFQHVHGSGDQLDGVVDRNRLRVVLVANQVNACLATDVVQREAEPLGKLQIGKDVVGQDDRGVSVHSLLVRYYSCSCRVHWIICEPPWAAIYRTCWNFVIDSAAGPSGFCRQFPVFADTDQPHKWPELAKKGWNSCTSPLCRQTYAVLARTFPVRSGRLCSASVTPCSSM